MLSLDYLSYEWHQITFGWFHPWVTAIVVVFGASAVFFARRRQWRNVVQLLWIGAILVPLPQLIPFTLALMTLDSREHGGTFFASRYVMLRLFVVSEIAWWPVAWLALWFGKAMRGPVPHHLPAVFD